MSIARSCGRVALAWVALATAAWAQAPEVKLPPSPPGQTAIQVGGSWSKTNDGGQRYQGGKWLVVDYSRPLLRGRRDIFAMGESYGAFVKDGSPVWRAGANATTTLTTQAPIIVGGTRLEPGVYNVFVDLRKDDWTLVLTTQPRQPRYDPNDKVNLYGSYNYDPKFDVARVKMATEPVANGTSSSARVEAFTIGFLRVSNVTPEKMVLLTMAWDDIVATAVIELAQ